MKPGLGFDRPAKAQAIEAKYPLLRQLLMDNRQCWCYRTVCRSILSACARYLSLAHFVGRYIRRETAQEELPDQIIHDMTGNADQAIG